MKMYNNGQRPTKMYGGGMAWRKPMQMGGLTQQNRKMPMNSSAMADPTMGSMTEKKRFSMGMKKGGKVKY